MWRRYARLSGGRRAEEPADVPIEVPEIHHARELVPDPRGALVVGIGADAEEAGVLDIETSVVLFECREEPVILRIPRGTEETEDDVATGHGVELVGGIDRASGREPRSRFANSQHVASCKSGRRPAAIPERAWPRFRRIHRNPVVPHRYTSPGAVAQSRSRPPGPGHPGATEEDSRRTGTEKNGYRFDPWRLGDLGGRGKRGFSTGRAGTGGVGSGVLARYNRIGESDPLPDRA